MDLNRATLIGNITRSPELKTTTAGQNVATFGVATNVQWTDAQGAKQQRAEFHNIVVWGKLAEICNQYLAKGSKVYLDGRLQTREWETQDGQKRQRTEIVLDQMIMLDRKKSEQPSAQPVEPAPMPHKDGLSEANELTLENLPF